MTALSVAAAPTSVIVGARISSLLPPPPRFPLLLPLRRSLHASTQLSDACRFSTLRVRADPSEDTANTDDFFSDLKEKWDATENKSAVFLYSGGAIVVVSLSSVLVEAIDSVPLLPKIMELVGLVYTGWFVYRYLLFKMDSVLNNNIKGIIKPLEACLNLEKPVAFNFKSHISPMHGRHEF